MITKTEIIEIFRRCGQNFTDSDIEHELQHFDEAVEVAIKIHTQMPGIGFASARGRVNCFLAVCRHLDSLIESGEIDLGESQLVMMILRLKDKKFQKAISMFDFRANRCTAREIRELPKSAREYLAGLKTYG